MTNVKMTVVDGKLTIEVDLKQRFGYSTTGKSLVVASSGGFEYLGGEFADVCVRLNVNAVTSRKSKGEAGKVLEAI